VSKESAIGAAGGRVFPDTTAEWSGDHCMDHDAVPGILLSNRPLRTPPASLAKVAGAILAELGVR
jgi:hypothetical protein